MPIKFSNNASSTLASSITTGSLSLAVASGEGLEFPTLGAGEWFMATLVKLVAGVPTHEIVKVTARSTDTLTIVRAQEGTTALSFAAGDKIEVRVTAGGLASKVDADGAVISGNASVAGTLAVTGASTLDDVGMADNTLSRAIMKDCALAYNDSTTVNTINYENGQMQRWAPNTGAQTLAITNWPPTGNLGMLMLEGVNLGAATITTATIKWVKSDGTFNTNTSMNTNQGATLNTSGIDFVMLWTRDAGTTIYGKVMR